MKATRTLSSYILLVGVMGLSIVGGVVAYQIYSASTKSQTTTQQAKAIKSLDGAINQTIIDNLEKRTVYTDAEMGLLLIATPTPEITETVESVVPESTGSATTQIQISE